MKIAVAYQNGEIYEHFGHCPLFAVYEYGEYVTDCTKTLVDTSMISGHHEMAAKIMTAIAKWITSASDSDPTSFLSKLLFIIVVDD